MTRKMKDEVLPPKTTRLRVNPVPPSQPKRQPIAALKSLPRGVVTGEFGELGKCERALLGFLARRIDRSYSKTQVAVMSGYSQSSSGFANAVSALCTKGLVKRVGQDLQAMDAALSLVPEETVEPLSISDWAGKLGKCERSIFELLEETGGSTEWEKEELATQAGYSVTSSGFANALSKLCTLGLAVRNSGGTISLNPEIKDL